MDKKDYLLGWGLNFVDNFKFEDEAKLKRRFGKNYRTKKLPLNYINEDYEQNILSQHHVNKSTKRHIGRLNKVATIKIKNNTDLHNPEIDDENVNEEVYNHTLFVTKTILSSQIHDSDKSYDYDNDNNDIINNSEESSKLSSLSSLDEDHDSIAEENDLFDEISHHANSNLVEAHIARDNEIHHTVKKHYELKMDLDKTHLNKTKLDKRKLVKKQLDKNQNNFQDDENKNEKFYKLKQFPHLKDFFQDFYPIKKKLPNDLLELDLLREPSKYIDIITKGGMGTPRLIENPENTNYNQVGYIYLDDQHKITNQHFQKFKPSLYKKPNAVKLICTKIEEMLLEKEESVKKKHQKKDNQKGHKSNTLKNESTALECLREAEKNKDDNKDFPLPLSLSPF